MDINSNMDDDDAPPSPVMPPQVLGVRDQHMAYLRNDLRPCKSLKVLHVGVHPRDQEFDYQEPLMKEEDLFDTTNPNLPTQSEIATIIARLPPPPEVTDTEIQAAYDVAMWQDEDAEQKAAQQDDEAQHEREEHTGSEGDERADAETESAPQTEEAAREAGPSAGEDEAAAEGTEDEENIEAALNEEFFGDGVDSKEENAQPRDNSEDESLPQPAGSPQDAKPFTVQTEAASAETDQNADGDAKDQAPPNSSRPMKAVHESFLAEFLKRGTQSDETQSDENGQGEQEVPRFSFKKTKSDKNVPLSSWSSQQPQEKPKRQADEPAVDERAAKKRRDSKQTTPEPATQEDDTGTRPEAGAKPMTEHERLETSKAECRTRIAELEQSVENADTQWFAGMSEKKTAEDELAEAKRQVEAAEQRIKAANEANEAKMKVRNDKRYELDAQKRRLATLERNSERLRAKARRDAARKYGTPPADDSKSHPGFGGSSFKAAPKPDTASREPRAQSSNARFGDKFKSSRPGDNRKSGFFAGAGSQFPGQRGFRKATFYREGDFDTRHESEDEEEEDLADRVNREAEEKSRRFEAERARAEEARQKQEKQQRSANPPPRPAPPPPPPSQPVPTMTAPGMAIAASSIDSYNNFWSTVFEKVKAGETQTVLPCPLPVLDDAGLRAALRAKISNRYANNSVIECLNTMRNWSLDNVVTMLAMIFFLEATGVTWHIDWRADNARGNYKGWIEKTTEQNAVLKKLLRTESMRWHEDRLDPRTGTKGTAHPLSRAPFVQSIWQAICHCEDLFSPCRPAVVQRH